MITLDFITALFYEIDERSCTRPLRIIILPPNRVQCPQLNPF